ncbi:hypothetical protein I314_00736 [Cryptococcus bacillisporus CA1873]|uniref:Uncharacterized protein n=2 Tax=Cryptococcus gattii TaxID=552467 RepID=A0A0D0TMV6_CRYGA|nr:hypothetical protein I312_02516 [Cryptococcus bacillisporus CA1280]KIR69622.1 hypothetical protein I314_00736 [Cryptococcus bacillisporus CA1873]|eukprot:KIR69622.1 hypothetical protein I314_00736 [Cryptococcus gattii CA1873]
MVFDCKQAPPPRILPRSSCKLLDIFPKTSWRILRRQFTCLARMVNVCTFVSDAVIVKLVDEKPRTGIENERNPLHLTLTLHHLHLNSHDNHSFHRQ